MGGPGAPDDMSLAPVTQAWLAVRPVRSASRRSSTSPACETMPVPPPVTSRPRDHPVPFTLKVLLELER